MKQTILSPADVRAYVEAHRHGRTVAEVAADLQMSRAQLFEHMKSGVVIDIPATAHRLLSAAGVEVVGKKKR